MIQIPEFYCVKQEFCHDHVKDVRGEVIAQLNTSGIVVKKGACIAIAAGSRGIANIPVIVRAAADWVRTQGGEPFVIPAMGSHGNGIASEQAAILRGLGITEESAGAPIRATMDVAELPRGGMKNRVFMDRFAYESDGVIVINRIKIHGDFVGETESGLLKMCVIGLGKHRQALEIHQYDISEMRDLIVGTARQVLASGKVLGGIGILENAYHETMEIKAVRPSEMEREEIRMLRRYKEIMPAFPVDDFDILIVDEIGKEISGAGMETKIVGRMKSGAPEPEKPSIRYIVTTDLTEASHGNACGVGIADFITRKLFDKIDIPATNENIVTCRCIEQGRIPIIAEHDRQAVEFAIRALGFIPQDQIRMIRIRNTLRMQQLYMTRNLLQEAESSGRIVYTGTNACPVFADGCSGLIPFEELSE